MDQKMEAIIKKGAPKEQQKRWMLLGVERLHQHLSRLLLFSKTEKRCDKDHLEESIKAAECIKENADDSEDIYAAAREVSNILHKINPKFGPIVNDEFQRLYDRLQEIKNFKSKFTASKAPEMQKEGDSIKVTPSDIEKPNVEAGEELPRPNWASNK